MLRVLIGREPTLFAAFYIFEIIRDFLHVNLIEDSIQPRSVFVYYSRDWSSFNFLPEMDQGSTTTNVLVGVTGSVAAVKLVEIVRLIAEDRDLSANLRVVMTENSKMFINPSEICIDGKQLAVYEDADERKVGSSTKILDLTTSR